MKFIYVDGVGYISLSAVKRAELTINGENCWLFSRVNPRGDDNCIGMCNRDEFERLTGAKYPPPK